MWSHEARLMFRPEATYERLMGGVAADGPWLLVRRPLLLALVLAAFISFTTTGRLTLRLLLDGLACWSFVPALNVAAGAAVAAMSAGRLSRPRAVDFLFSAFGPWYGWLLGVAGLSAFAPAAVAVPWSLHSGWLLPASFLVAMVWSAILQYRFLRTVAGAGRRRAVVLLAGLKLAVWGTVVVFFGLTNQLAPRILQHWGS